MLQVKFSIPEDQVLFLNSYKDYGFKDKSQMMRTALNLLQQEQEMKKLRQSADLSAEVYSEDADISSLGEAAVEEWPK